MADAFVFRKTGAARQSELIKLIAGFEPPGYG
jgi:hypothetical protein